MNQSRATKIRKQIYGNATAPKPSLFSRIGRYFAQKLPESFRAGRTYRIIKRSFEIFKKDRDGNIMFDKDGSPMRVEKITRQRVCTGLRAQYKQTKKAWKEFLRAPA